MTMFAKSAVQNSCQHPFCWQLYLFDRISSNKSMIEVVCDDMMMIMMMMMMMMIVIMMMMMKMMIIIIIIIIMMMIKMMMMMMVMVVMMMIMIMIIIIIALKGAIRFFTISSLRREPSPTRILKRPGSNRVQITRNTNHAQHIERLSHATWRITCPVVRRDSSAIELDRVEIAFI